MNRKIFKKTGFGLKLPVALGVFALAGGFPAFALAQKESPNPAPADTVQLGAGIGGAGYAVPSNVYVPPESVGNPMDAGITVHTDLVLPAKNGVPVEPSVTLPGGNTPASLGCVYGVGPSYAGCKIPGSNQHPTGGWGAIALVDAYDNPDAATDYTIFSSTFHLPTTGFSKFGATGGTSSCSTVPTPPGGHSNSWALESSLDIEWAHAMAPSPLCQ
jgi:kumamolisin